METNLSDNDLRLNYRIRNVEKISDPKNVIETAIERHHETLTSKQRKYAVKIGDLYDLIASEIPLSDLDSSDSFRKLKGSLSEVLSSII